MIHQSCNSILQLVRQNKPFFFSLLLAKRGTHCTGQGSVDAQLDLIPFEITQSRPITILKWGLYTHITNGFVYLWRTNSGTPKFVILKHNPLFDLAAPCSVFSTCTIWFGNTLILRRNYFFTSVCKCLAAVRIFIYSFFNFYFQQINF